MKRGSVYEDEQMQTSKKGSRFQMAEDIGEKEPEGRENGRIEIEGWIIEKIWSKRWGWRIVQENRCKWRKTFKE